MKREINGEIYEIKPCANLCDADLCGADLRYANLRYADLCGAHLRGAHLRSANLRYADLCGAHLRGAHLCSAHLCSANLRGANLRYADLCDADLRYADLCGADLRYADLTETKLPHFQIPQEGSLVVWGKKNGLLVKMEVPAEARRTATPVGRKCRAEYVKTLWIECGHNGTETKMGAVYEVGQFTYPDSYDDDIRVECTHGIHFFLTREEAEEWM